MLNEPNIVKIRESVLFLLNKAADGLSPYQIAKALFLADVSHLNTYGRPVTYDNYVAMQFGPVPSKTYDLLSNKPERLDVQITDRHGTINTYSPLRQYEEIELSESDEFALHSALGVVETLTFAELKTHTHEHAAWKDAWDHRKNNAPKMKYALLFEERDQDQADYIARFSKQAGRTT